MYLPSGLVGPPEGLVGPPDVKVQVKGSATTVLAVEKILETGKNSRNFFKLLSITTL